MIDGYCHCGVSKYRPVEDVLAVMNAVGVERAVLVQHLGEFDNSYLAEVVHENRDTFRAVGLVDPSGNTWMRVLDEIADARLIRGLRITRETVMHHPVLCRMAAERGLFLMIDAPRGIGEILSEVRALTRLGVPLIISHFGYPRFEGRATVYGRELFSLASYPHVHVMFSHPDWPEGAFGSGMDDFAAQAIDVFGPTRLIWGSNFPVADEATYRTSLGRLNATRWSLKPHEVRAIAHANAATLWFA